MKVFKFNPDTGRRGDLIEHTERACWTDRLAHAEDLTVDLPTPQGFGRGAEVGIHMDAGRGFVGEEISYAQPTEWICFCLGCWRVGINDDGSPDEQWQWVVLPPQDVRRAGGAA